MSGFEDLAQLRTLLFSFRACVLDTARDISDPVLASAYALNSDTAIGWELGGARFLGLDQLLVLSCRKISGQHTAQSGNSSRPKPPCPTQMLERAATQIAMVYFILKT